MLYVYTGLVSVIEKLMPSDDTVSSSIHSVHFFELHDQEKILLNSQNNGVAIS
jgi:hypothetical protein